MLVRRIERRHADIQDLEAASSTVDHERRDQDSGARPKRDAPPVELQPAASLQDDVDLREPAVVVALGVARDLDEVDACRLVAGDEEGPPRAAARARRGLELTELRHQRLLFRPALLQGERFLSVPLERASV